MLKNYLKIALRNLRRHKGYAFINVFGLGAGLACCLLILLYVQDEVRYDRYHEAADRIYRVAVERHYPNRIEASATTPRPLARALAADFPEVLQATRLSTERADRVLVRHDGRSYYENRVVFADANVFDVFTLPMRRGNPQTALAAPFSVVLTETTARKYFGEADPLGQTLTVRLSGDRTTFDYRVTGVVTDVPAASHFHFDLLASYQNHPLVGDPEDQDNWLGLNLYTYVRLRDQARPETVAARFPAMVQKYAYPQVDEVLGISPEAFSTAGNAYRYFLQPITDIHLHSHLQNELEPNSDVVYVYLFAVIALLLLLIACINFTNLATARSAGRSREVGVRKALGAHRPQLIRQFLVESGLLTGLAFLLAMALVEVGLPAFNAFTGKHLAIRSLNVAAMLVGLPAFVILTGLLAGTYPAYYLSGFRPIAALKGRKTGSRRRPTLRNGLVVFQFAVSSVLIIGTLVVTRQMHYVLHKNLGFDKAHVLVVEGTETLGRRIEAFRQAVQGHRGIVQVANGQTVPGRTSGRVLVRTPDTPEDNPLPVSWMTVGAGYVETLGLAVTAGRSFSPDIPGDSTAVLLTETTVKALGLTDPIGKTLIENDRPYTIVGVVEDFHFNSLHESIGPFVFFGPDPWNRNRPNQVVVVRIRTDDLRTALPTLEAAWQRFVPEQPFTYSFLDADLEALYRADRKMGEVFGFFAGIALLVAGLGLFGLAAFTAEQRTKEIGIRKVLGASIPGIVALLTGEFTMLVVIAYAAAAPIAYVVTAWWLENFAYRVAMSWSTFLLAGLTALGVALLTVSYQAIRAALTDPVKALRYE